MAGILKEFILCLRKRGSVPKGECFPLKGNLLGASRQGQPSAHSFLWPGEEAQGRKGRDALWLRTMRAKALSKHTPGRVGAISTKGLTFGFYL